MTDTRSRRRRLRPALAAAGVAAALPLALAACGGSPSAKTSDPSPRAATSGGSSVAAATVHVTIKSFAYNPANFTVKPGGKIIVTNKDSVAHTLTDMANKSLFNTGLIDTNRTKTITAPTKPGRYPFFCLVHNYMTGVLTVS
jgi:plastocyanin